MKNAKNDISKRLERLVKLNKELVGQNKRILAENEILKKALDEVLEQDSKKKLKSEKVSKEKTIRYRMATVLYAHIHGFSKVPQNEKSKSILDNLDDLLFLFDDMIKKNKVEKIRTIGDTIVCAGGIPIKNITNPIEVVMTALDMQHMISQNQENLALGKIWELTMGVHTGAVTATILKSKKISYDLKGETVNIAARIGSSGALGKIIISVMTYEMVKDFFVCEYYGKMPIKFSYSGDIDIYLVKGLKPKLTDDKDALIPNKNFRIQFNLRQFHDLQEIILDKMEKELPQYLYYHNVKHTVDVITEVELIGFAEGVTDEEILLLKTAALFHDLGHIIAYENHEFYGTEIARKYLPNFNYSKEQIDKICNIILATKLPPKPTNLLEEIICDSDLDYLGRSDFIPVSNMLYKELKKRDSIGTFTDWNKMQVKFISGHQYFTKTAQQMREVNKQKQIERIQKLIDNDPEGKMEFIE